MKPVLVVAVALALGACSPASSPPLQGYVEGEYVLVAAPAAGTLEKLFVSRGQIVEAGSPIFRLEHANEDAARLQAAEQLRMARERLANLEGSRRPPEIEAAAEQAKQAQAAQELSTLQLKQQERLFAAGFISKAQMDAARASYDRDVARFAEVRAQTRLAKESIGRTAEIRAARADVEAARAALAQADWRLEQRSAAAAAKALVQDTYFVEGEWVPAGRPIASLLPPGNIKVRFFVPETQIGGLKQGAAISLRCDGCAHPIAAAISYISPQAEYTPPVIYSKESRAKLVFMVEARPGLADAPLLHPGQPVDVGLSSR